jgi:hypothetical protein
MAHALGALSSLQSPASCAAWLRCCRPKTPITCRRRLEPARTPPLLPPSSCVEPAPTFPPFFPLCSIEKAPRAPFCFPPRPCATSPDGPHRHHPRVSTLSFVRLVGGIRCWERWIWSRPHSPSVSATTGLFLLQFSSCLTAPLPTRSCRTS